MNDLPLHPALVHLPLGLAMALPFVAIGVALAIWRGRLPRAALAIVAGLQLLLAGSAFAAMQLGQADEEKARRVAPAEAIHAHEEAGESLVWFSVGVLAISVAGLFVPARRAPLLAALAAVGTLAVAGLAVDAGRKGGELVFRYGAQVQAPPAAAGAPAARAGE